ncbi:MAG TPA: hypothetical protein VKA76_02780 [Gammaproteobacteria bacterium]|nr:hypothetical protein [Gammaproteobacteria bacterium]
MMGLPNCREVALLLSREHDQPTRPRRTLPVRIHLLICKACRPYERQLDWLQHTLRRLQDTQSPTTLEAAARERIQARLRQERDRQRS